MNLTETPITLIILAATVLTSYSAFKDSELKRKLLFNPYLVKEHNQWYRAFSHAFIHGDSMHLIVNMFVFYSFGTSLESVFTNADIWAFRVPDIPFWGETKGRLYFILLYVGGFLFSTLPSMLKHSANPSYNSLGASGAVSAVLFANILLFPGNTLLVMLIIPAPAFLVGIGFLYYESYMDKRGGTGVAHDAHLFGAIYGVLLMALINYKFLGRFIDELTKYFQSF